MLYIGIFVSLLILLGVFLLLKKKALKEYEMKPKSFKVIYLDTLINTIREADFPEVQASSFLAVNIDDKEDYIIFGPNTKHSPLMDFFLEKHSEISGRSWLLDRPDIKIYGGGKIYYSPEKKLLAFYDGSDDFGVYEKDKIEKFHNEIEEIFSVNIIDYSHDNQYNYEKAPSAS
ncbi:MAG: hypothetical protein PHG82_03870 [Candidatus Gracilibacteria bacterium]|nr:hypothetical protein [Candidatus Gracilibacteria bacterium]